MLKVVLQELKLSLRPSLLCLYVAVLRIDVDPRVELLNHAVVDTGPLWFFE